jgi:GPN-loop GTPase
MADFEKFQDASEEENSFSASLTRSMNLVLEEFYKNMRVRMNQY